MSFTIGGPASVNSCDPILNMPATSRSSVTRASARSGVSTSSATISLSKLATPFFCAAADGCVKVRQSFSTQYLFETFVDFASNARPAIDETGVQLNETRTGADLFPRIFGGEDSANTHDRNLSFRQTIKLLHHLRRFRAQRCSA